MTTTSHAADVQYACTVLSSPTLIRLITEIDDNGPIPPRGLTGTLADRTPHHIRQATDLARALGLVRVRPGVGLDLTTSGRELADLYDATVRWARHHAHPAPVADFISRIQRTFALLAETEVPSAQDGRHCPADDRSPSAQAVADLVRPRDLLSQWLLANPQAAQLTVPEPAA
ncbi:hypothetical protein SSP35_22_00210 [Streptomyces sp. NBRC 110611]|uniref:hypothetical protein n=1 Tax=Streptomyces sp. NBRC 110611 TaxID=1621259 RepID=UPI00082D0D5B|nr:hypothetical protein [Streptomyces sp. NBRC 110611]GAU70718.1 hypothetical protein SSP35_22_00210 [Streptomyces sp. NBRC 110611]